MHKKIMEHFLIIKELEFLKKKKLKNVYLEQVEKVNSILILIQESPEAQL